MFGVSFSGDNARQNASRGGECPLGVTLLSSKGEGDEACGSNIVGDQKNVRLCAKAYWLEVG